MILRVLTTVVLAVLLVSISACDRIVTYEPDPQELLPDSFQVIERANYTPSGAGTEYRSTYWLVAIPPEIPSTEALESVAERLGERGDERELPRPEYWPTRGFTFPETAFVDLGPYRRFAELELDLHRQAMADFAVAADTNPGEEVVILFVPVGSG